jgi:lambda family phage portal protein
MFTRLRSSLARALAPSATSSAFRRFDGAAGGRRGFGIGTFHSINPEVAAAGATVRARARYLANNNPFICNAIANWTANLVGAGIMPTAKHSSADIRKALGAQFIEWANDADADCRTDFFGLQADVARGLVLDGEAFLQLLQSNDGFRIRIIPPELIDESMTRELADGTVIVQGVEFDTEGKRAAYWILPQRPASQFANYAPPVRVAADDVLHIFKPLAAGQVRGISWLAPIILPASEFDQLIDALLMGVKVAALHAGFIVDQNANGSLPYDGDQAGSLMTSGIEPGTLKVLPQGLDIKFNSPQQANETAAFIRLNLQSLAAGIGLPEHLLSGDLTGANYSSLRAGLLPFRQRIEQIQYGVLVPQMMRPVWQRVVMAAVFSGDLEALDFEENRREYYSVDFIMPRPMQVDPQKDVEATIAEIDAKLTSRRKAVAERGWNLEELDAEILAESDQSLIASKPNAGMPS